MSSRLTRPPLRGFIRRIRSGSGTLSSRTHGSVFWNVSYKIWSYQIWSRSSKFLFSPKLYLWALYVRKKEKQKKAAQTLIYMISRCQTFKEAPGSFHGFSSMEQPHCPWKDWVWCKSSCTEEKGEKERKKTNLNLNRFEFQPGGG